MQKDLSGPGSKKSAKAGTAPVAAAEQENGAGGLHILQAAAAHVEGKQKQQAPGGSGAAGANAAKEAVREVVLEAPASRLEQRPLAALTGR